jgi:hypothetical protein
LATTFITVCNWHSKIIFRFFVYLPNLPNIITTEDFSFVGPNAMFLGEHFQKSQNDRTAVMFSDKQCHIPEGLSPQQLDVNTSVSPRTIAEMFLSLSIYGGPYLWWLLGLLTCRKLGVNSRTVYMGFMADKVAL